MTAPIHILKKLRLPARFEKLDEALGPDVVKLLTPPEANLRALSSIAISLSQSGEGVLIPCYGETGAGKTTLAENIGFFLPGKFSKTLLHDSEITYESLNAALEKHVRTEAPSADLVIPVNLDHREGAPPNDQELAAMKRFLRTNSRPCVAFWLDTDLERSVELADRYVQITGKAVVDLPLLVDGPDKGTWKDIALNTIQLCNSLTPAQTKELGIDPTTYDLNRFRTLGGFLRQLSVDFTELLAAHEQSTQRQMTLIICYVSEALERGCLSSFSSKGGEPGLLDSTSLLNCTPDSMIGKTWAAKRGILTQTIFRLDARAFWVPPAAVTAILRRYGPPDVQKILEGANRSMPKPADIITYVGRTDLGRYLAEVKGATYETRGRPAEEARDALARVAKEFGYGGGRDKLLNAALLEATTSYITELGVPVHTGLAEKALPYCPSLIPDNTIDIGARMLCVEYMWRSGDALDSSRRSEAAQYALEKLHNYAVNLGWTKPA
jgi:hypothetical protein